MKIRYSLTVKQYSFPQLHAQMNKINSTRQKKKHNLKKLTGKLDFRKIEK